MAEVLKVFHLAQEHGVAQVQVRRGGVEAGLDAKLAARFGGLDEALAQVLFADDLRHAFPQVGELFVNGHWAEGSIEIFRKFADRFHLFRSRRGFAALRREIGLAVAPHQVCQTLFGHQARLP